MVSSPRSSWVKLRYRAGSSRRRLLLPRPRRARLDDYPPGVRPTGHIRGFRSDALARSANLLQSQLVLEADWLPGFGSTSWLPVCHLRVLVG